ncbi:phage tail tube protein [Desulfarculus baarsii]
MSSYQVAGKAYIRVDGQLLPNIEGKATIKNPTGVQRETVMGADGAIGYKSKAVAQEIEATFAHTTDLDIDSLSAAEDVSITIEWDNGATYTISNAWALGVSEVGDGEIKITWGGANAAFGRA